MLRVGAHHNSTGSSWRAALPRSMQRSALLRGLRKPGARCAAQSLVEVMVAIAILVTVVWGMVGFLANGRILVERSGQSIIAAHVAAERIDRTRQLAYAAIANGNGTTTVGGIVFTWTLTVTATTADPGDANSAMKQVRATVTWPSAPNASVIMSTAIAP